MAIVLCGVTATAPWSKAPRVVGGPRSGRFPDMPPAAPAARTVTEETPAGTWKVSVLPALVDAQDTGGTAYACCPAPSAYRLNVTVLYPEAVASTASGPAV